MIINMKVVSFDVGIKNMAYYVLVVENNYFYIQDWGIINLMNEKQENKCCNFLLKGKQPKICKKKAKYFKNEHFLCETHAKIACKQFSWILPNNQFKKSSLNKKNKEELVSLGQKYEFLKDIPKTT